MKRHLITILFFLSLAVAVQGQTSVSFQNLGNATFQNNLINPSLIPEGKIFIGLPAISGVHFHFNNKLGYGDIFTKKNDAEGLPVTEIDVRKMADNLQRQNMLTTQVNINLLHFGYRLKSGPLLSFTINERIEADFLYSKELIDYLWNGNLDYLNQDLKVSDLGLRAVHFREFGFGAATTVGDNLSVGARAKLLVGFANVSTPGNFGATLNSNGEAFQLEADWQNAILRTSGLDIYEGDEGDLGSHLVMNSNLGVALDIGATYRMNKYYTFTGSLVDIGFINWKENIKNYQVRDTTFTYRGVNLDAVDDVRQTLEDSLFTAFDTDDNFDAYRSWLPIRAHGSWIYHYSPTIDIYTTVGARVVQRQVKMLYGLGFTKRFGNNFSANITATKLPQNFVNAGAAFAYKGGPVKFYMAVDQLINYNVLKAKSIDFRVGMNLVFGQGPDKSENIFGDRKPITDAKGLDTHVFLGKGVKTKKREGIYSIISKQSRRELRKKQTEREKKVRKKSLNGREGKKNTSKND